MIKAIYLVFEPAVAWDDIVKQKRGIVTLLALYLIPLLVLVQALELYGLLHWSRPHDLAETSFRATQHFVLCYGAIKFGVSLLVVFVGALLIKSTGEAFNCRRGFAQAFTLVAYGLGPLFLARLLDSVPVINQWASCGIGIVLTVSTLYHGVPRVLEPDPSASFGLYVISSFLLAVLSGLSCFMMLALLQGKIHIPGL